MKGATVLADIAWFVGLWLMVPLVIVAVGAPVALIGRLIIAAIERF